MYFGDLGQQGSTFTVRSQRGERPYCPGGSQEQSRHGSGLRESVTCYRAPVFAPPPTTTVTYHAPTTRTTVSPAIQAQISPQVSPVLTQAQASPGASVQAQPGQYMPGGMQARGGGGITAQELQNILAEQRRAEDERRAREFQAMQDTQQQRADILAAQREAEAEWRAEQEANRQAAEAEAMERAQAMPPPPTAGAFVPPSPLQPPLFEPPPPGPTEIDITGETVEAGFPVPWLLLAAAGVGTALLLGRKKGAKKR